MESYERLEKNFGEWQGCNNPNTVACSSGTAALHLAIEALGLPLGSEIAIPDYTMVACARAVTLAGMVPVFVDCLNALLMDVSLLSAYCGNVKTVMAVHIYGRRCDMRTIHKFASGVGIPVIEDMAEIHGLAPHPKTAAACWSFYRNKQIHGEEGGMVTFKDPTHAAKARCLRSLGFTPEHDFNHVPRGHNYRLANCLAELIDDSLDQVEINLVKRRHIEGWYNRYLRDYLKMPSRDSVWVYDVRINSKLVPKVIARLNQEGIAARHGFRPMSTQEEYKNCRLVQRNNVARSISQEIMYLPVNENMTEVEVKRICETFIALL